MLELHVFRPYTIFKRGFMNRPADGRESGARGTPNISRGYLAVQPTQSFTGWIEPEIDYISGERRLRPRHILQLPLQYKVLDGEGVSGSGTTRDLNTGGVCFEIQEMLRPGGRVELTIQWPVALRRSVPLQLVVEGRIAWGGDGVAAVRTSRCHFRTALKAMASSGFALP